MSITPLMVAVAMTSLSVPAAAGDAFVQHGTHEHGTAMLVVAVDGSRLSVELVAPAHDVVGFEHQPANEAERAALARAEAVLADHGRLLAMSKAAGCRVAGIEVSSPWPSGETRVEDHDPAGDAGPRHAHADFIARWSFDCAAPERLAVLEVKLDGAFATPVKLRADLLTDDGQRSMWLDRARGRLQLQ